MGCRLVAIVRKLRPKKMTHVTFYVATAFATANVRMLRLKQIRYIFYAYMLASILYNLISRIYESVLSCFLNTDVADFLIISEILSCVVVWARGVFIFPCNP